MRISPSSPNFHAVSARPMDAAASSARQVDHSRGYPVGDGTFASSVRGTAPQRERDLQLAMMSNDAYKSDAPGATGTQSERELEQAGWRRLRPEGDHLVDAQGNRIPISAADLHDPTTGFDAAIYQNAQGQYVVAYRGTDNWSPGAGGDLTTNAGQGAGLKTEQYQQAVALAQNAEKIFGKGNVVFTGHSLGGGLASAAMLATGAPGVTFNAAGLSDNTIRALQGNPNEVRAAMADNGQIRRYVVDGDLLTTAQQKSEATKGWQQFGITSILGGSLPDAVGHELHVKPSQTTDKSGLMGPVNLHGGGQDNTSYVEALRENAAYEKSNPLPVLNALENLPEATVNLLASAGKNVFDLGSEAIGALRETRGEMSAVVKNDLAKGQLIEGSVRLTGQAADAALDITGSAVRQGADFAGDVVMEGSTLVGKFIRNTGKQVGLESGFNKVASFVETAGQGINTLMDKAGDLAGRGLDKLGDGIQWATGKLGDGIQLARDATLWAAGKAVDGAKWAAGKAVDGAKWAAGKAVDGAKWAAGKAVDGARWAAGKVADGANWAAGKVAEGAKWLADSKLNPANWW